MPTTKKVCGKRTMNSTSIRTSIGQHIKRAIMSTQQDNDPQNVHNWVEISTDRIINEFLSSLPEPIDVQAKYEIPATGVVPVQLSNLEEDGEAILHLQRYADDTGYNRYRQELVHSIKSLYNLE